MTRSNKDFKILKPLWNSNKVCCSTISDALSSTNKGLELCIGIKLWFFLTMRVEFVSISLCLEFRQIGKVDMFFKICFYSVVLVYNNQHDHVAYFGIMYYAIVHEQWLKKRIASQRKHVETKPCSNISEHHCI